MTTIDETPAPEPDVKRYLPQWQIETMLERLRDYFAAESEKSDGIGVALDAISTVAARYGIGVDTVVESSEHVVITSPRGVRYDHDIVGAAAADYEVLEGGGLRLTIDGRTHLYAPGQWEAMRQMARATGPRIMVDLPPDLDPAVMRALHNNHDPEALAALISDALHNHLVPDVQ